MEQGDDVTLDWIDTGQVRALAEIAALTGEREIFGGIGTAVFTGEDVFDVVDQLAVLLPEETILAAITRTVAYQVADSVLQG